MKSPIVIIVAFVSSAAFAGTCPQISKRYQCESTGTCQNDGSTWHVKGPTYELKIEGPLRNGGSDAYSLNYTYSYHNDGQIQHTAYQLVADGESHLYDDSDQLEYRVTCDGTRPLIIESSPTLSFTPIYWDVSVISENGISAKKRIGPDASGRGAMCRYVEASCTPVQE